MTDYVGYYPDFRLPSGWSGPDSLVQVLRELWGYQYCELYEPGEDQALPLEDAFERLVDTLWPDEEDPRGHARCMWLLRALAEAAVPTMKNHLPSDERGAAALALAARWPDVCVEDPAAKAEEMFPADEIIGAPAVNEGRSVLAHLIRGQDPQFMREGLLDALDDCFEGAPIISGSSGRRDLFNWLLVEVVPAAWDERLPERLYTLHWPWPPKGQPRASTRPLGD